MAQTILVDPNRKPSSEAASAALLLASIAWNIAVGLKNEAALCRTKMKEFEECNPSFWNELKSRKCQNEILRLAEYKKENYPDDNRVIIGCAVAKNKVRVEWIYAQEEEEKRNRTNRSGGLR